MGPLPCAILARLRGVAQPGSALRSGRRGPQFKSGHPDRRGASNPASPLPARRGGEATSRPPPAPAGGGRSALPRRAAGCRRAATLRRSSRTPGTTSASASCRRWRCSRRRRPATLGWLRARPVYGLIPLAGIGGLVLLLGNVEGGPGFMVDLAAVATPILAAGRRLLPAHRLGFARRARALRHRLEGRRGQPLGAGVRGRADHHGERHAGLADGPDRAAPRARRRHPRGDGGRRLPGAQRGRAAGLAGAHGRAAGRRAAAPAGGRVGHGVHGLGRRLPRRPARHRRRLEPAAGAVDGRGGDVRSSTSRGASCSTCSTPCPAPCPWPPRP